MYNSIMLDDISIIVPTFNEEHYLPKLLTSISKQTLKPKEVIVSDAYSSDKTREIAESFGCKIVNGGLPAKARNEGAKAATSQALLFLDADVVLPRDFLEKCSKEIGRRRLAIAAAYITPIKPTKKDYYLYEAVNTYLRFTKHFYPHAYGCCIFVKKGIHDAIGGFDESLVMGEDHDYVRRARKKGIFSFLTSYKIPVSERRLVEDGRLVLVLKYILIEFHLIFIGKLKPGTKLYHFGKHTHDGELSK